MSSTLYDSDDGEDFVCPLCCEPMDLSDQNFLPCPCGYRVCMWCWHRIKENYTNRCPACRAEYSDDPHVFAAVDKEQVIKNENNKKKRTKQKEADSASAAAAANAAREYQHALHLRHQHQHQQHMQHLHREQVQLQQQQGGRSGAGAGTLGSVANRRDLSNMRVVQRNLVYVTGLPAGLDSEEVLRKPENFGQYGKIYKIATSTAQGNVSAHITFAHKEDALACILATDGLWVEGRQLRSNFGTTKYCATYLRNIPCSNPECLYLHELGEEEDRFTKEEIQHRSLLAPPIPAGVATTTGGGGPSGTGKRCSSPFLPPPVYESRDNGSSTSGSASSLRGASQQGQHSASSGAAASSRGATRGAKPTVQVMSQAPPPKPSTSIGVAWGGAGTTNGPSNQSLVDRSAVGIMSRRKGSMTAPSPTASPHLRAHDAARLQEEWPSLADTAASSSMQPTSAAQTAGRGGRNRRKKEKQQQLLLQQQSQQQHQHEEGADSSPTPGPSMPSPQEPSALPPPASGPRQAPTAEPTPAVAVPAPSLSQPPGLKPIAGAPSLPLQTQNSVPAGSSQGDVTVQGGATHGQESIARTVSAGQDDSTSMFSNTFFSSNGDPPVASTTASAPPGLSGLVTTSIAVPSIPSVSSISPTAAVVVSSSQQTALAPASTASPEVRPPPSIFEERFPGNESIFNGELFPSTIGGGLFAADVEGVSVSPPTASTVGDSLSGVTGSSRAVEVLSALHVDRSSARTDGQQGFSLPLQHEPSMDGHTPGFGGLVDGTMKVQGKAGSDTNNLSDAGLPDDSTGAPLLEKRPMSPPSTPSPLGTAFCGGHFGGAFGSALFPVSTAQSGGTHSSKNAEGGGADLSVDPFANSSGALAAMLGVTLPPVDSQSSLANKMRAGTGGPRSNLPRQNTSPPHLHLPPRRGIPYSEFPRDAGQVREGHGHVTGGARDVSVGDRGHGYRHDFGANPESSMLQEHRASRFSFAQDGNSVVPFSPAARSSSMGSDPRGSPGRMVSPPHPGQHRTHLQPNPHTHHPFGVGRPLSPQHVGEYGAVGGEGQYAQQPLPLQSHHHPPHHSHHFQQQRLPQQPPPPPPPPQQQQYSIQNGMAFLQKVLPGVQLSYGDRHPPAATGGGQSQGQGQGSSGAPGGGGVGWGDNAAGQRVDPAQAFGSSLWTMAPAPNAPRQPQGSRGAGYGAW